MIFVTLSRRLCLLALCGLLSACGLGEPSFEAPDRSDPVVQREEARIAAVLAADTSGEVLSRPLQGPPSCQVRLLRQVGAVDYAYAHCRAGDQEAVVAPVKLEGRTVTLPDDGSLYGPSIQRIFPADIAAALGDDEERFRP